MVTPAWLDTAAYPFTHRSFATTRGRVHYVDEGSGETLLFVHGTPTWSFEYRHLIKALSARYRCVAPDHLGFGLSERPTGFGYRPEEHAAVLAEFVTGLGLRDYTLVVHDFGGPIGLPLALVEGSGVKRVVVLNSWMWAFDDDAEMQKKARFSASAFGRWMYRRLNFSLRVLTPYAYGDKKKLTPEIHRQYRSVFPTAGDRERVLWALARALLDSREFYVDLWNRRGRFEVLPLLLIWGLKDRAFMPRFLEKWRAGVPSARVEVLAEAGHWPHEEQPEKVRSILEDWLTANA